MYFLGCSYCRNFRIRSNFCSRRRALSERGISYFDWSGGDVEDTTEAEDWEDATDEDELDGEGVGETGSESDAKKIEAGGMREDVEVLSR